MVDDEGNIHTDPVNVAELLCNHWSQVFKRKHTNRPSTALWLKTAYPEGPPCKADASECLAKRHDVSRATQQANASAPGPDGVSYLAWQRAGSLGTDVLWAALHVVLR